MSFWSAMVAIVAILAFTSARIARYRARLGDPGRHHHALREMAPPMQSPRELALEKEVEDLRQRIAVLERIATEDRHSKAIAQEIESLRNG
jgi:hypothetical protein